MKIRGPAKNASADADPVEQGRAFFQRKKWAAAFEQLSAADSQSSLQPQYLVELAQPALLIAKEAEGAVYLARAHQGFLSHGETQPAVRSAFWLGFIALLNGEVAKAGGWLSRASRLLEGCPDCVEHGYLLMPVGYRAF